MKKAWWLVVLVWMFITIAGEIVYVKFYSPKIAFVNNNLLYKEFKGKVELEKKFIKEKESEQVYLDSLYMEVKVLDDKIKSTGTKDEKQRLLLIEKKKAFDRLASDFNGRNKQLEDKYLDQIWNQINQYIKDYGKEKGYDFILGAQGNGSLMFAVDSRDITKEVSEYCNKKYDGK